MIAAFVYWIFSTVFMVGATWRREYSLAEKGVVLMTALLCGWALMPFVMGQSLRHYAEDDNDWWDWW